MWECVCGGVGVCDYGCGWEGVRGSVGVSVGAGGLQIWCVCVRGCGC